MHVHVRIHRWVIWWFYVGVICGIVALANILGRDLTRSQERLLLAVGIAHWLLGGIICYACEGIMLNAPGNTKRSVESKTRDVVRPEEWHAASDFLLPGNRKSLLKDYLRHHHNAH